MAKQMAIESASYSRLMLYFSISTFLEAHAKYVEKYAFEAVCPVLKVAQEAIREQLSAMTDDLGNIRNSARG